MGERLARGARIYIRRELGQARQSKDPRRIKSAEENATSLRRGEPSAKTVETPAPATTRIQQIDELLARDSLTPRLRAELSCERIWLQSALQEIGDQDRRDLLLGIQDELETESPDDFDNLNRTIRYDELGRPISRFSEIRDRAMELVRQRR